METHEFIRVLGKGSYGYVLSAISDITGMKVAIKFLDGIIDEAAFKEAIYPIKIIFTLKHPNLIQYYNSEHIREEERVVIFMELADHDLNSEIKCLSEDASIKYFLDLCEGIKYLHSRKLVHRDIKPSNILIVGGIAKIAGFGLIMKLNGDFEKEEYPLGTLFFMPPEVLKGEDFNEKWDIWSLGITLHLMLSKGNYPFNKNCSDDEVKVQILSKLEIDPMLKNTKFEAILKGNFYFFINNSYQNIF